MNMLYIDKDYRNKGIGKELVGFWESEMKYKSYDLVMTSTLSNEQAQQFYRKIGYKDCGSLLLENEPLEIIFTKKI
jgi:ribosomal protein S18 acetylase RimI-like enzyme